MRRFDWEAAVDSVSIIGGWPGQSTKCPTVNASDDGVRYIRISMESGHMANIAFVAVTFDDGSVTMIPATQAIVTLAPQPKEEE